MEDKYNEWFQRLKKAISTKIGREKAQSLVSSCLECKHITNDVEMATCIRNMMHCFDEQIPDDSIRYQVMETMGSYCVSPFLDKVKEIGKTSKNLSEMVDHLNQMYGGEEFFKLIDNEIHSELDDCVCHFGVKASKEDISDTYCQCSLGYMKSLFHALLGKDVDVKLSESVLRGGNHCKFVAIID